MKTLRLHTFMFVDLISQFRSGRNSTKWSKVKRKRPRRLYEEGNNFLPNVFGNWDRRSGVG
jgi:hypothetical protein